MTHRSASCHQGTVPGTPNGILAIIIIGELNGMILPQTAMGPLDPSWQRIIIGNRENYQHSNGKT